MMTFTYLGFTYRTNADASLVEGLDGTKWNRTNSLRVILEARRILGIG